MVSNLILVHPKDNVAIALNHIVKGEKGVLSDGCTVTAKTDIPVSHKILLADLSRGDDIIKYGEIIGQATLGLEKGEWIHTHNLDIIEE